MLSAAGPALRARRRRIGGAYLPSRSRARQRARRAKLPVARVAALEALPGCTWLARDRLLLDALMRYAAQHGHTWMAQDTIDAQGFPLGQRVGDVLRAYASDCAHPKRLADELEAVPGWSWQGLDSRHLQALDAIRAFVAREGHALVPVRWREGDVALGLWVQQRRHEHRARRRRIAPALITFLEALPYWAWDLDGQPTQRFVALLAFARRHGNVDIPYRGREANGGLAYWVDQMRTRHAQGRLSGDATALLERIPGWSWSVADQPQAQAGVMDGGPADQTARWRPRVVAGSVGDDRQFAVMVNAQADPPSAA